jgi:uncharacterized membrane protein YidH (DUF202 family)
VTRADDPADAPRAGDRLVRLGVVVFAAGLVAIAVIFVPFAIDLARYGARRAQSARNERGVALNLATFLVCVGLGLALAGLVRQARESRAKARAASPEAGSGR